MTYDQLAQQLLEGAETTAQLDLNFAGCHLRLWSNHQTLLDEIDAYFHPFALQNSAPPPIDPWEPIHQLTLLESSVRPTPTHLCHWPRPADKGVKEAFADLADGRIIQKTRSGLLFLQGVNQGLTIGPLSANINQVINFINNQTISHWKRRGWEICHAAAVEGPAGIVALAGFSGGGKSTLALHLMNAGQYCFVSNDRVLINAESGQVHARGVAKMPRVNPGTLLHNPTLGTVLSPERQAALASLSQEELWELEEKYDAPMGELFGYHRIAQVGCLRAVVILDWDRQCDRPTRLERTALTRSSDMLSALMKSPGPFHADANGNFVAADDKIDPDAYWTILQDIPIYRLTGHLDFTVAVDLCRPLLEI